MTILTQAVAIRDETETGANTATRVGTCLVDIAGALVATKAVGNVFMVGNSTPTVVSNTTNFFKIAGTTTDNSELNYEFTTAVTNRLVYSGTTTKTFKVSAIATVSCDHGSHVMEIGLYSSALAAVDADTVGRVMIQAGASKPTQICCEAIFSMATGAYIELHLRGVESAESYIVSNLNIIIAEI